MYFLFVNDFFLKEKADFIDPSKKVNLGTGLKTWLVNQCPQNKARCIINTQPVMRAMYTEHTKNGLRFTLPSSSLKPLSLEYVKDVHRIVLLVLRTPLEGQEDNLRHECTCKV